MQRKRAMNLSQWCARTAFVLVLASLLISVFASDASARRRGKPASLTDSVIFQATHLVTIGGYEPTTENIATASKLILKDLADTQKAKALAGNIPTREFKQQQEKIYRAITQVDNRVQQLQRKGRRDPVKQFFRVVTAPVRPVVRAIVHVSKQVEKLFPPVLRPIVQVVLAQYVGKKYDSLVKKLISKFASPDAVKAYNMWKKLVPYKDNPALAAKELQARLKELAQGRIGEFMGKLTERALAKLPPDSPLREVITTKMEMWRASLIKNAQKEIDVMFEKDKEKFKKRVEKTAEGLLQPIPSSQLKKKVDQEGKEFRDWVVESTTGVAPKKEGEEEATKVKAAFDAKPDRGPAPLNVEFNAGRSEGEIKAYVWEFGDKKMGVGKIKGYTYSTPGEYEVTLTVVAEDGTKDTAKWSITVEAKREIELKAKVAAAPKEVQPGGKVAIEAEISTGGLKEGNVNVTIDVNGQVVLKKTEAVSEYDINVMAYYDVPENLENVTRTVKVTATCPVPAGTQKEGKKELAATATDTFTITKKPTEPKKEKEDPFVGTWNAVWELEAHSHMSVEEVKKTGFPTKLRWTFAIRKAGDKYVVDPAPFVVEEVSVSGNTITIKGHGDENMKPSGYWEQYDREVMTLTLKNNNTVLEGTHRTDFARFHPSFEQEYQTGTVRATR